MKKLIPLLIAAGLGIFTQRALPATLDLRDGSSIKDVNLLESILGFDSPHGFAQINQNDIAYLDLSSDREGEDYVRLLDGSVLRNLEYGGDSLPFSSPVLGDIDVLESKIKSVTFGGSTNIGSGSVSSGVYGDYVPFYLDGEVWLKDVDGKNPRQLTYTNGAMRGLSSFRDIQKSPDRKYLLLFIANSVSYDFPDGFYLLDPRNGRLSTIIESPLVGHPVWSPDGTQIAFNKEETGSNWEIYRIGIDGSNLTRVTFSTKDEYPEKWSGEGIVFIRPDDTRNDMKEIYYAISPDGGEPRRLN